jgi:hypothetical protein
MRKTLPVVCVSFIALLLIVAIAAGQVPSTTLAKAGGRHGKFHFVTDEQLALDDTERAQMRERLIAFRKAVDILAKNDAAKTRILGEIQVMERYINNEEARSSRPASTTAAQAEAILNAKKGMMQCTFCHEGPDPSHAAARGVQQH